MAANLADRRTCVIACTGAVGSVGSAGTVGSVGSVGTIDPAPATVLPLPSSAEQESEDIVESVPESPPQRSFIVNLFKFLSEESDIDDDLSSRESDESEDAKIQLPSNQGSYLSPESDGTSSPTVRPSDESTSH